MSEYKNVKCPRCGATGINKLYYWTKTAKVLGGFECFICGYKCCNNAKCKECFKDKYQLKKIKEGIE